jgi:hypothetical protein
MITVHLEQPQQTLDLKKFHRNFTWLVTMIYLIRSSHHIILHYHHVVISIFFSEIHCKNLRYFWFHVLVV